MTPHKRLERQMVEALKKNLATGRPVDVPEAGKVLWVIFSDLCASRSYGGFGPNPISYGEIQSYSAIKRWPLSGTHIAIIRAMDFAWLEWVNSKAAAKTTPAPTTQRSAKLNPDIFDALFQ